MKWLSLKQKKFLKSAAQGHNCVIGHTKREVNPCLGILYQTNGFNAVCFGTLYIQFPSCTDEEAISVACLDLHYHVTVHETVHSQPEKKESHLPVALSDLQENDGGNLTLPESTRKN